MSGGLPLRIAGAALAVVAAGIHALLSVADLIPGEPTRGPLFAAMALGFAGCAALLFARRMEYDVLVLVYTAGLMFAYWATRGDLPIEGVGLATQAAELGLLGVTGVLLLRRRAELTTPHPGPGGPGGPR
ncbi:MAG TPA: hypothetical protein VF998_05145 [Candidatus Limnocylindria bacterium]